MFQQAKLENYGQAEMPEWDDQACKRQWYKKNGILMGRIIYSSCSCSIWYLERKDCILMEQIIYSSCSGSIWYLERKDGILMGQIAEVENLVAPSVLRKVNLVFSRTFSV